MMDNLEYRGWEKGGRELKYAKHEVFFDQHQGMAGQACDEN